MHSHNRPIAAWLLACCAMVFVMVVLGGLTRLTESGLSMVEWRPLSVLPPLSESEWQESFAKYQLYPEYKEKNVGMTLSEYKGIFWLEFIHRNWGRLLGVVFLVPFVWFLARGWVDRRLGMRLGGIFILGGLQGGMGWFMVASGLSTRPDVSQYRLTVHLGLAVLILAAMFWLALDLLADERYGSDRARGPVPLKRAMALVLLTFVTILSGGFVAGLDAGFAYNTFPLMDGRWVPEGLFSLQPALLNLFENTVTVQFDHRILAETLVSLIVLLWLGTRRALLPERARLALNAFAGMALVQLLLGIGTLLLVVPTPLAATHQAGAVVLFTLGLWLVHELRGCRVA